MLEEYALRFYALIEQSLKLDAMDWRQRMTIASSPYMEDSSRQEVAKNYEKQSHDIIEEIREAHNEDMDKAEELLNGS